VCDGSVFALRVQVCERGMHVIEARQDLLQSDYKNLKYDPVLLAVAFRVVGDGFVHGVVALVSLVPVFLLPVCVWFGALLGLFPRFFRVQTVCVRWSSSILTCGTSSLAGRWTVSS